MKYILYNCSFKIKSKVFQQVIVITMRSDPAHFMTGLFLFFIMKTGEYERPNGRT